MRTGKAKKKSGYLTLFLGLAIFFSVILYTCLDKSVFNGKKELPQREIFSQSITTPDEPIFFKEGELLFLDKKTKKKIVQIDIEIADTPYERATGLMYRRSMPDTVGMLFIFKQSQPLFFWMKNTYIPLDIIFVDKHMQIVTIQKNTKPLSGNPIPSYEYAMYVVEVNAGFCDKNGITIGDYIVF